MRSRKLSGPFCIKMSAKKAIDVEAMDEDEDDIIDEEQLAEYRDMIENLGTFPVS